MAQWRGGGRGSGHRGGILSGDALTLVGQAYAAGIDGSVIIDAPLDELGLWQRIVAEADREQDIRNKNLATLISNAVWAAVKSK
jgi:hypothetical protein